MGSKQRAGRAPKSDPDDKLPPKEAQRRMDEAVKRLLSQKPETRDEMIRRKHRKGEIKPRRRKAP